ncbi:MAG: hypothetical protein ACE5G1_12080 [bacterium]
MKARQLFTASLGLALLGLIVWMIMSDGDPETDALQANTFTDSHQTMPAPDVVSTEPTQEKEKDWQADNSHLNSRKAQPPVKPSKTVNAETKPKIPARPSDIPTEEYVRKNQVLLDKISRNYQRILDKKKGN